MELETSPLSRVFFFCCPSTIEHRLASAFSKNGIIIEIEKKEPKGTHFLVEKFDTYLFIKQQTQHICAAFWAATVSFGFVLSRKCTVNCLRKAFFFCVRGTVFVPLFELLCLLLNHFLRWLFFFLERGWMESHPPSCFVSVLNTGLIPIVPHFCVWRKKHFKNFLLMLF